MKRKSEGYKTAGLVACIFMILAISGGALIIKTGITGDGSLYFVVPSFLALSLIAGSFWLKGFRGTETDKKWVRHNW